MGWVVPTVMSGMYSTNYFISNGPCDLRIIVNKYTSSTTVIINNIDRSTGISSLSGFSGFKLYS